MTNHAECVLVMEAHGTDESEVAQLVELLALACQRKHQERVFEKTENLGEVDNPKREEPMDPRRGRRAERCERAN